MPAAGRSGHAALSGAIAAGFALGVGEVVTAVDDAGVSLVSAVGDELIDTFAGPLKDLAVALFGTNDKVALIVGIVVVALGVGAWLGTAGVRRRWLGPAGFAAFGLLGAWAYSRAPLTSAPVGVAAGLFGGAAGIASLRLLLRLDPAGRAAPARRAPGERAVDDGVALGAGVAAAPAAAGGPTAGADRRTFLVAAGSLGAGAAALSAASRRLRQPDPSTGFRAATAVPDPSTSATVPARQPFDEPGLSPYVTPTDDFFRIDTALIVPRVDPATWTLSVTGAVARPFDLTLDELLAMDAVEAPVTLQCVSNEIGGELVGNAVWQGVPLAALLDRAGVEPAGAQVVGRSVDGWTAGFPTELATDGRTALVAYAMNGALLRPRHGFPARLVVAGLYGYVSATKWLSEIELAGWEDLDGYWIPRGWAKEGPIKVAARIDVPRAGAELRAGPIAVAGVAWAPTRGISAVEVKVDDDPWRPCQLGDATSDETWVQWRLAWDAPPGEHVLRVRARTLDGDMQTDAVAAPAPDGATGHHARRVRVRSS